MGIGERQIHRRGDSPATRRLNVEGEHKPSAGYYTEHRDGRTDATVTPDPVHIKCEVDKHGVVQAASQVN